MGKCFVDLMPSYNLTINVMCIIVSNMGIQSSARVFKAVVF